MRSTARTLKVLIFMSWTFWGTQKKKKKKKCPGRLNAGNKSTHSMRHPRRWNMTTSKGIITITVIIIIIIIIVVIIMPGY